MVNVTNDVKYVANNLDSSEFKNTSMSSINTVTSKTTATLSDKNVTPNKKRLESMTDEEIIQRNLKELMEKKNREERKANGRLVALILATLVIILAIYHAWIRKPGMLSSILVPAVIMLSFGGWVVILAKRDKARRQMFEKYLEEVALKNKEELEAKSKSKSKRSHDKKSSNETLLHFENEINKELLPLTHMEIGNNNKITKTTTDMNTSSIIKYNDHRKHRKHRNTSNNDGYSSTSSSSSKKSSHYATKDLRVKRPSIRQKLFRQTGFYHMPVSANATQTLVQAVINSPMPQCTAPLIDGIVPTHCQPPATLIEAKRKRLQRLDTLKVPTMVRMGSAP
ncbi:uncharacterized protein ACRADG_007667 [Cochliomyia hominivorax]